MSRGSIETAAEQGDEADEAFAGTVPRTEVPAHARAGQDGRGHRFAAYPRCWADEMSAAAYARELQAQGQIVLAKHPAVRHEWRERVLVFPRVAPGGFEITLEPDDQGITVYTDVGFHQHVEADPFAAAQGALGLVRDLLSADMRIRELLAGGRAYRWVLERRSDDRWMCESQVGLLFWKYFARRSERIWQNAQLPGRLAAEGQPSS